MASTEPPTDAILAAHPHLGGARLQTIRASGLLDSPPQREFDDLVRLAADLTGSEIALVTILDDERQWFKAAHGTSLKETPVGWSFCVHAIKTPGEPMVVEDATLDQRVQDSPLVTDQPGIRAYLGMPLCAEDGTAFGTLCVIDRHPRGFSEAQRASLRRLARLGEHLINHALRAADAIARTRAESEQALQRLVMMLTYGIDLKAFIDRDGCYRYVNRAFVEKYGRSEAELVGLHVATIVGEPAYRTVVGPKLAQAMAGEEAHYLRLVNYPVAGQRWMEVSLFPVHQEDGQVSGVVLRARDVHDLVLANQKLHERAVGQEQFIAVLAHDVREPLRTIRSYIDLAVETANGQLPAESADHLRVASRGTERLARLVNGLLAFLQADGQQIPLESTPLGPVLAEVMDDLRSLTDAAGARVSGTLDATVHGHPVWLRLCLQNLIANAVKFARPGVPPVVRIVQRVTDTGVEVRVVDNGMGVPPDQLERIFEPFVRMPAAARVDGAGLGLSLCRRIARLHRGSLQVECTSAEGSTFVLRLPGEAAATPDYAGASPSNRFQA